MTCWIVDGGLRWIQQSLYSQWGEDLCSTHRVDLKNEKIRARNLTKIKNMQRDSGFFKLRSRMRVVLPTPRGPWRISGWGTRWCWAWLFNTVSSSGLGIILHALFTIFLFDLVCVFVWFQFKCICSPFYPSSLSSNRESRPTRVLRFMGQPTGALALAFCLIIYSPFSQTKKILSFFLFSWVMIFFFFNFHGGISILRVRV